MAESAHASEPYRRYVTELEYLVAEQGWDLKKYPRSKWYAFKPAEHGKAAFGIGLRSDNTPYLYIKRVQDEADSFLVKMTAYNEIHDQAEYDLELGVPLKSFTPLLKLAYQRC